eukprot:796805-Pyramimonas_sp.AAC.1
MCSDVCLRVRLYPAAANATSRDCTLRVWDPKTRQCVRTLEVASTPHAGGWEGESRVGSSRSTTSCVVSPAGEWVVSTHDDGVVRVWSTTTWKCVHQLHGRGMGTACCAIIGRSELESHLWQPSEEISTLHSVGDTYSGNRVAAIAFYVGVLDQLERT